MALLFFPLALIPSSEKVLSVPIFFFGLALTTNDGLVALIGIALPWGGRRDASVFLGGFSVFLGGYRAGVPGTALASIGQLVSRFVRVRSIPRRGYRR